jgi:hypothetical protein
MIAIYDDVRHEWVMLRLLYSSTLASWTAQLIVHQYCSIQGRRCHYLIVIWLRTEKVSES